MLCAERLRQMLRKQTNSQTEGRTTAAAAARDKENLHTLRIRSVRRRQ